MDALLSADQHQNTEGTTCINNGYKTLVFKTIFPGQPGKPVPVGQTVMGFTETRDDRVVVASAGPYTSQCTSLQSDNQFSASSSSLLQIGCSSCHQINSVKALKNNYRKAAIQTAEHYKAAPYEEH